MEARELKIGNLVEHKSFGIIPITAIGQEKLPTAEEFFNKKYSETNDKDTFNNLYESTIQEMMIEFAKMHVTAALEAASEKAICSDEGSINRHGDWSECYVVDKDSILNAYDLNQIK